VHYFVICITSCSVKGTIASNDEMERFEKKYIAIQTLVQHLPGRTEENLNKSQ
jgi:hypothetical protein